MDRDEYVDRCDQKLWVRVGHSEPEYVFCRLRANHPRPHFGILTTDDGIAVAMRWGKPAEMEAIGYEV
jgi:hypothetical protein